MNTLRETDEGPPKPSVWPVYVVAAVFGVAGLLMVVISTWPWLSHAHITPWNRWVLEELAISFLLLAGGLLLVITGVGLVRLRPWAWWCAVGWTTLVVGLCVFAFLLTLGRGNILDGPSSGIFDALAAFVIGLLCLPLIVLLGVALVTRRPLFFPRKSQLRRLFSPPKPEGEE